MQGVALKTEADGRMFPVTDDSQTIIDALGAAADRARVTVRTNVRVEAVGEGLAEHDLQTDLADLACAHRC